MTEQADLIDMLNRIGCDEQETAAICRSCEEGRTEDAVRILRICRMRLMDQLHQNQSRVDDLDFLVYHLEKTERGGRENV